jgi:hypothetical protein
MLNTWKFRGQSIETRRGMEEPRKAAAAERLKAALAFTLL